MKIEVQHSRPDRSLPELARNDAQGNTSCSRPPVTGHTAVFLRPQTVTLSFAFDRMQVPNILAGARKEFRFTVTNAGASAAEFVLNATTSTGEIRGLSPNTISLQPGASATPTLALVIPPAATTGDYVHVRLEVTSSVDPLLTNSTTFELEVAPPDDVDIDRVPNDSDVRPAKGPAGTTVTISGNGFDPTPARNTVMIGNAQATVRSATATRLVAIVPHGAATDHIIVVTPTGFAASVAPFLVERSPDDKK